MYTPSHRQRYSVLAPSQVLHAHPIPGTPCSPFPRYSMLTPSQVLRAHSTPGAMFSKKTNIQSEVMEEVDVDAFVTEGDGSTSRITRKKTVSFFILTLFLICLRSLFDLSSLSFSFFFSSLYLLRSALSFCLVCSFLNFLTLSMCLLLSDSFSLAV